MKLILASASPRRLELLKELGYPFSVCSSPFEEKDFSFDPVITATAFAKGKAQTVFNGLEDKEHSVVVGADTVVYLDGEILGKPENEQSAKQMLENLSNKTHTVITGYAVISNRRISFGFDQTLVTFNDLSTELIDSYIASGLYKGKAGSYGIQDNFPLVKEYKGSLNNVIGFPTEKIFPIISDIMGKK